MPTMQDAIRAHARRRVSRVRLWSDGVHIVKKASKGTGSRPFHHGEAPERLEIGRRVCDRRTGRVGEVLDYACQYAHPKADPVYNYLIRWDDGQVQAIAEGALFGPHGVEPID